MACDHKIVRHGLCSQCKSSVDIRSYALMPFNYIGNGIYLRPEFVGDMKRHVWNKSLKRKKLTLVLGLHCTLYDSRQVSLLSEGEKYLTGQVNSRSDLWKSNEVLQDQSSESLSSLFKLRPFVHEFLREANKMFVMHVFELCNPKHTKQVISLLDPHETYFEKRVITNKDNEMKNLDHVLADERGIVILDDRHVYWWPGDDRNLLQILPYHYFKRNKKKNNMTWIMKLVASFKKALAIDVIEDQSESKSLAEERGDESYEDGGLANALGLLKEIHNRFFHEQDEVSRDVRTLLSP